jgi:hypothetical protein
MPPRARTMDDVWSNVDRTTDPSGCWPWTAADHRIRINGRRQTPARLVLEEAAGGKLRPGVRAKHVCGNTRCCRPDHLTTTVRRAS